MRAGIGTKIILPYLLLTLVVAGIGAFVVSKLVTDSLQERLHNQLLDAGRVVSESMVDYEEERLKVLRMVAHTEGVATALIDQDRATLAARVPQIVANSNTDAVELLDLQGREVYGWQRPPNQANYAGEERSGADFSTLQEVRRVLDGYVDEFGDKRVLLSETPYGPMIFTLGPVYRDGERAGVAMVGTYLHEMTLYLSEKAAARVTLYNPQGRVIDTTFGGGQDGVGQLLREPPGLYDRVLALLQEPAHRYEAVVTTADHEVPLAQVQILGQDYLLAYGDWRLRNQSMGLFSVALPRTFILSTAATSRNFLSLIFFLATVGVFLIGFWVARRIVGPLQRLVAVSRAVSRGDLQQRTGIRREDEIGSLASSFDTMTEHLAERNRQLIEQASKLEAILNSIADGVMVLDQQGQILSANRAAQQVLADAGTDLLPDLLAQATRQDSAHASPVQAAYRCQVGSQIYGAMAAPVQTPTGEELGTVIALRNVTREAEVENLKDDFITTVSHELRTPLTAIMGYSNLLLKVANGSLGEPQTKFLRMINENTDKLTRHINQMIDISQIQAGTLALIPAELQLCPLVSEVIERWRERIEGNDLSLYLDLPAEPLWISGDKARLDWAVDNLLNNACNYTLPSGEIRVNLFRENGMARLDVIDTGIGIAETDQPYLFTRFFRASNIKMFDVRGVGLGLFVSRTIIEAHGGRIWVKSKLDQGSQFSLALPLLDRGTDD